MHRLNYFRNVVVIVAIVDRLVVVGGVIVIVVQALYFCSSSVLRPVHSCLTCFSQHDIKYSMQTLRRYVFSAPFLHNHITTVLPNPVLLNPEVDRDSS